MSAGEQPLLMAIRQEQGVVSLSLSTGEVFELAPDSVPERLPAVGESLEAALVAEIREAAERKNIARRLFLLLDRRLNPVAKTRKKLLEEGFSAGSVDAVLEQMAARGLYSDRVYAAAWCRTCLLARSVGRQYLVAKLRGQQVPAAIAGEVVAEVLDPDREAELARVAAAGRWRRTAGRESRQAEAKVIRFLQGRGFALGLAVHAARATKPEPDAAREDEETP